MILATLVYDWLEDDVEFIISSEKVIDIMKDPNFNKKSIYNVENASNHYIIQKNKESRKELFEFLKSQMLNVEFETLLVIAQFFEVIHPEHEDDMECFIDTIDRFCVHLMGYKYTEAYRIKSTKLLERITIQVTSLCTIIRLIIIGIKYDFGDNPYHPGIKNIQVTATKTGLDNSFHSTIINHNNINFHRSPTPNTNQARTKFSIFSANDNFLDHFLAMDSSYSKKPTLSEYEFTGNGGGNNGLPTNNNISDLNNLDSDQQEIF